MVKVGIFVLIQILRIKLSSLLQLSMILAGFFINVIVHVEDIHFDSLLSDFFFFIIKGCAFCEMPFLPHLKWLCDFYLHSIIVICYIDRFSYSLIHLIFKIMLFRGPAATKSGPNLVHCQCLCTHPTCTPNSFWF